MFKSGNQSVTRQDLVCIVVSTSYVGSLIQWGGCHIKAMHWMHAKFRVF